MQWIVDEIALEKDKEEFLTLPKGCIDSFNKIQEFHEQEYARAAGSVVGLCPRPC